MKIEVSVKHSAKAQVGSSFELAVNPGDTALAVKERISLIVPTPFLERDLIFESTVLRDEQSLGDCGVVEKSTLEFVVKATEQEFVKQLTGLLQDRTLDTNELGLLYAHKFGVSVRDALRALNCLDGKLRDFLELQKCFIMEPSGLVSLAASGGEPHPASPPLCTIGEKNALVVGGQINVHVTVNVLAPGHLSWTSNIANLAANSSDTVAQLKERVALVESLPFPEQSLSLFTSAGKVALENEGALLESCGVEAGSHLFLTVKATVKAFVHQLVELLEARSSLSPDELSNLYCYRHGITAVQALRTLGLKGNFRRFLESHERFCVKGGCIALADVSSMQSSDIFDSVGKVVDSKALVALDAVIKDISEASFLNVHHITKDAFGSDDPLTLAAEIFLTGLPPTGREKWLPGLLRSVAVVLEERLIASNAGTGVDVVDNALQVHTQGSIKVTLRFSPTFWP